METPSWFARAARRCAASAASTSAAPPRRAVAAMLGRRRALKAARAVGRRRSTDRGPEAGREARRRGGGGGDVAGGGGAAGHAAGPAMTPRKVVVCVCVRARAWCKCLSVRLPPGRRWAGRMVQLRKEPEVLCLSVCLSPSLPPFPLPLSALFARPSPQVHLGAAGSRLGARRQGRLRPGPPPPPPPPTHTPQAPLASP